MKKTMYLLIIFLLLNNTYIYADFSAKTNKKIDITKNQYIEARIINAKGIIKGMIEESDNNDPYRYMVQNKDGNKTINLKITWTDLLIGRNNITLNNMSSILTLRSNIIKRGTIILIKGSPPKELKLKDKDDKDDKDDNYKRYKPGITGGSTNITSSPAPSSSSVDTNKNENAFTKPTYITTYDGCEQIYDPVKEIIKASQRIFYIDKNDKEKIVQKCKVVKEYPAEKKTCSTIEDFDKKVIYFRYQPYFKNNAATYAAGGCVTSKQNSLLVDYSVCEALSIGDSYIKKGKWYYTNEKGEQNYLSSCILDPENKVEKLLVQYEGCPVYHNVSLNQSKYLGKYYRILPDKTKDILTDCTENKEEIFEHLLRWDNQKFQHDFLSGYSQKLLTRYISIPTENREVIINDKELDPIKIPHKLELEAWENHDYYETDAVKGYSFKIIHTYIELNNEKHVIKKEVSTLSTPHKYYGVYFDRSSGSCGFLWMSTNYYYRKIIQRPDGTTYMTNTYSRCE